MRKLIRVGSAAAFVLALAIPAGALSASEANTSSEPLTGPHDLGSPMSEEQQARRQQALEMKLQGKIPAGAKVGKVAKGQYVELAREDTDRVFVIIAEFGNTRHPSYPDGVGTPVGPPAVEPDGPAHNNIWEPDRAVDNTTLWQEDFNQAHYDDMYFNRMAKFYERQSSGRYSVDGDVTEWVAVPFNEARYGRDFCGGIVCSNTWWLISHGMARWVQSKRDAGWTQNQITDYLETFDEWDRYDYDGDGNFDEPDGYIDHFQIVHAGGDQAAGDPQQLGDAIWSHRWYVQLNPIGAAGPTVNGNVVRLGGINAGAASTLSGTGAPGVTLPDNPTGVWVGDYTIQPENGGLGVFAHEYGHDLGLPDLYDTSGNTGGAENSTGFWTLMSSGANIGDGGPDGIGDQPTDLGAWEKFQLGWLNYEVAFAGRKSEHKLGPAEFNTKQAQGLFVVLPDKAVSTDLGDPYEGPDFFYSGAGDDLDVTMTKSVTVGAGVFSARARYEIELDWDYAYLTVNGNPVATNISTATNPNNQNFGNGITGSSGGNWVSLTADLSAFAGKSVTLGFRYWTDGAVVESGFQVDDITLDGTAHDDGWTFDGFRVTTGEETAFFFNAYLAENRQYVGDDNSLKTAYNFGFLNTRPDWVEHFPYQDGVLISYWDTSHTDNNVGDHPGEGEILPIDAHPTFEHWYDGQLVRPRIVTFDSTFGLQATDAITVHKDGQPTSIPSRPAVRVFDDTNDWWSNADQHAATGSHAGRYQPGWQGVKVPKTGTLIRVKSLTPGGFAQVEVRPK
jgi:immune inhibitor A